jgi:hypothetical protein
MSEERKPTSAPAGATFSLRKGVTIAVHGTVSLGHSHAHGAGHGHGVRVEDGFVESAEVTHSLSVLPRGAGVGKVLFFDCPAGISGDMTLSALLDLGAPAELLLELPAQLGLPEATVKIRRGYVGAIGGTHVDVLVEGEGRERSYTEIVTLIGAADLSEGTKEIALRVFARLGLAEATVHRTTLDSIHFHEVGAVDALIDIVGAAKLLDHLGAKVVGSPVPLGRGFVQCRHGVLPLPAPAALLCLEGVPTYDAGLEVELVTPTGAAILSSVASSFCSWPSIIPERVGIGTGTQGLPDRPNLLRVILGEESSGTRADADVYLCEANVDDMTPEVLAYALERLLEAGALDAWVSPISMKKGRVGFVVSALSEAQTRGAVVAAILKETSSIGVRQSRLFRDVLPRRIEAIETRFGTVRVKVSGEPPLRAKPEFDDCAAIARRTGHPLRDILAEMEALARERYLSRTVAS